MLITDLRSKDWKVRSNAARGLAEIGPGAKAAVPALIQALRDEEAPVWVQSSNALERIGEDSVPGLVGLLGDDEPVMRWKAIAILERIGPRAKAAVPQLTELLCHPNRVTRRQAAGALPLIEPLNETPVSVLLDSLQDQDTEIRLFAAERLSMVHGKGRPATPVLAKILEGILDRKYEDENYPMRCMLSLWRIGADAKDAVPVLIRFLERHPDNVRRSTIAILAAGTLLKIEPENRIAIARLMKELPQLIDDLKEEDEFAALFAADTLGRLGPAARTAVPALTKALMAKNPKLRDAAAQALRRINQ